MNNVDDAQPVTRPGRSAVKPAVISQIIEGTGPASEALKRAKESLAGPFLGITTDGSLRSDLFPIAGTGVSTQPIIDAAEDLLRTLSPSERETASFEISDDYAWRSWHNMHFFAMRHGLLLHTLDDAKRDKVYGLMRATLSAPGFANARDIMRLNHHAGELTGRLEEFDELYYWISLFGRPSASEPWGWQIDGHHLSINCFILGDQIVLTPDFRGSEPTVAKSGKFAGTRVFAEEEARGPNSCKASMPGNAALRRSQTHHRARSSPSPRPTISRSAPKALHSTDCRRTSRTGSSNSWRFILAGCAPVTPRSASMRSSGTSTRRSLPGWEAAKTIAPSTIVSSTRLS